MPMADRISTLPDSVLCHILSFLPTQDAVSTGRLSKRWKPLRFSVPTLDLDYERYDGDDKPFFHFIKFIYAAILTLGVHQPIKRFRLRCESCREYLSDSDLNLWISTIVRHPIEHLHVALFYSNKLPSCIFNLRTLVVLKVKGLSVKAFSSVYLPSLKALHLNQVDLPELHYFVKLLSGCPVLEDLKVKSIYFNDYSTKEEFQILSNLVKAHIRLHYRFSIPLKVFCNVQSLSLEEQQLNKDYLHVFPNLNHLELIFGVSVNWSLLFEMLKHCPKLQILVLNMARDFALPYDDDLPYPHVIPTCVSSQLRKCCLINYMGEEDLLQFVKYILQNSRALQTMTICTVFHSISEEKLEILKELSLCRGSSASCEILFNYY